MTGDSALQRQGASVPTEPEATAGALLPAAHQMIEAFSYAPDEVIEGAFGSEVFNALLALRAAAAVISLPEGQT